jgi:hypothetical protein
LRVHPFNREENGGGKAAPKVAGELPVDLEQPVLGKKFEFVQFSVGPIIWAGKIAEVSRLKRAGIDTGRLGSAPSGDTPSSALAFAFATGGIACFRSADS